MISRDGAVISLRLKHVDVDYKQVFRKRQGKAVVMGIWWHLVRLQADKSEPRTCLASIMPRKVNSGLRVLSHSRRTFSQSPTRKAVRDK